MKYLLLSLSITLSTITHSQTSHEKLTLSRDCKTVKDTTYCTEVFIVDGQLGFYLSKETEYQPKPKATKPKKVSKVRGGSWNI